MMRSAWAWNCAVQCAFTVFGETAGKIALRSAMCASPSLRIMLWPISLFIRPAGWCEREHVDLLLGDRRCRRGCVSSVRAELRHEGDRRLLPQSREHRIGVGPECGGVDVDARRGAQASLHCCSLPSLATSGSTVCPQRLGQLQFRPRGPASRRSTIANSSLCDEMPSRS